MASPRDVAALAGTLRKDSINRKAAHALIDLAPSSLRPATVEIGQLPSYNQDDDVTAPGQWTAFRDLVHAANAILFVTPGYNRSVPAPLRNAIDVGSHPYGQSAWNGKPGAVVSASPGAIGGFGANHHLRQSFCGTSRPLSGLGSTRTAKRSLDHSRTPTWMR